MIGTPLTLNDKLIDTLYVEAMVLADEARSYFDREGQAERDMLSPLHRVSFSCEALRVTTRLMHVIAWLLVQRAVSAGEISTVQGASPERRLGEAQDHDFAVVVSLPLTARAIIASTSDLYARVARLDAGMRRTAPTGSPAQGLMRRLEMAF